MKQGDGERPPKQPSQVETLVDPDHDSVPSARFISTRVRRESTLGEADGSEGSSGSSTETGSLYEGTQERFGRYVILEELGRGGMGIVHAAFDVKLGRKVAIKFVRDTESQMDTSGQARLVREAQAMARLTHPNIVTVFDVGKSPEGIFLAMEYVPGQTIADWLRAEHPPWKIIRTFLEAGRGLAAAHDEGIVHRDFKPSNVLIGRDGRVKVADFGLAAIDDSVSPSTESSASARELMEEHVTRTGARLGTPAYMAPEQHQGLPTSGLSDQFSYCVSLWEAVYGQHPFPGPSAFARAERVTTGNWEPPRDAGRVSEAVRAILTKGLSPLPEDRHPSMRELLHHLESALNPGASQRSVGSTEALHFGQSGQSLVGGRYRILEPHPANPLLHVTLDRLSGTFAAIEWAGGKSSDGFSPPAHLEIRLADQFRALAGTSHPHLVGVRDFGYDDEYGAFIAYHLPRDAVPLLSAIKRATFDAQVNFIVDIVRAVGFLNARHIHGVSLTPQDVVVLGERAQLLGQLLPRGQRLNPEGSLERDLAQVARLALVVFGGSKSRSDGHEGWARVDVPDEVRAVFERLSEAHHGLGARELVDMLGKAAGRRLDYETMETREASLRSTSVVGRRAEEQSLRRLLLAAVDSRGSLALIRGESGMGKSRFVDEFSSVVLESGNRIHKGQAENEASLPYEIWRGVLRSLVAESPIGDYEASVLAWVLPDIGGILGRPVERAAELDAQAMRQRLAQVTLDLFRSQSRTLVIVLEDIQWADAESLLLLQHVRRALPSNHILMIATLKSEDSQVLSGELGVDEVVELLPLNTTAVQRYTRRLVGDREDVGEIAAYAYKHSEGNPLFLTEIFRTLADEAGSLGAISASTLPRSPRSGGLRRAIQERLGRLPSDTMPLLRVAAVMGRQFDPRLLETARPNEKVSAWLGLMRTPAVIEQGAGVFRFTHDKLREAVLDSIEEAERRALHIEVAEAMEQSDGEAALIAHHFLQAEDPRAARYAALAGAALVHTSPAEATRLLESAIELGDKKGETDTTRWRQQLAEAYFDAGRLPAAAREIEVACEKSGKPLPHSKLGLRLRLAWEIAVQVCHLSTRKWSRRRESADGSTNGAKHDWVASYDKLAEISFFRGDNLRAMTLCMMALNESDRTGVLALNSLGIIAQTAGVLRLPRVSAAYFERGRAALMKDEARFHPVFFLMEVFSYTAEARFEEARAAALRGYEIGLRLGHTLGASQCMSVLGLVEFNEGQFSTMLSRYETIFDLKEYNVQHDAGPSGGASTAHAMLGNEQEARALGQRALEGASEEMPVMKTSIVAGQALVCSRIGDHERACTLADQAMENFDPSSTPSVLTATLVGPMEAYLGAWRAAREFEPHSVLQYQKKAQKQLVYLKSFARLYPMGRAFALQAEGQVYLLMGKDAKARRAFQKALASAEKNGLAHRAALIRTELARLAPRGSEERREHLASAAREFTRLQTVLDLRAVEDLKRADSRAPV